MKQIWATIFLWSRLFITTNQCNLDVALFRTNNCVFFCTLFGNTSSTALVLNEPFEDMDYFSTHTRSTSASIFPNEPFYYYRGEWDMRRLFDVKSEPILDDRWEDLKIEKFEVHYINKNLRNGEDFMISFSVRTKQNAEIIICNGNFPSSINDCYWIILSAYNGTKSLIRKALGGIHYDKDYAECTQPLSCNEKKNVITESEWRTFTISGHKDKFFQLSVYELGHSDPLLSYKDTDNLIGNLTNILFSNFYIKQQQEKFYSYWKFLNYNFAYTNQSDKVLLTDYISKTSLCLSMTVALCNECRIDVTISNSKKTVREFHVEATKNSSQVLRWQTSYINIASNNTSAYKITFKSKINVANTTNSTKFWAVSSIKECSNPDWKYIMYLSKKTHHPCSKSVNCQTIAPPCQVGIKNFSLGIGNAKEYLAKRKIACKDILFGDYCDSSELYVGDNSSLFENTTNLPVTENTNLPVTENRTLPVIEETSPSNIILKTTTSSHLGGNSSGRDISLNNDYIITKWAIIGLAVAVFLVLLIIIVITSLRHYLEKYKYKRELRIRNETPMFPSMDIVVYDDVIDHVYEEPRQINYANVFPNQASTLGHIYNNV